MAKRKAKPTGKQPGGVTGKGFMPGRSGNPSGLPGRPPGESLTKKIRAVLDEPDGKGTKADKLIGLAVKFAEAGDFRYFKEIMDRMEGKVPDRLADADGGNLKLLPIRLDGDKQL